MRIFILGLTFLVVESAVWATCYKNAETVQWTMLLLLQDMFSLEGDFMFYTDKLNC